MEATESRKDPQKFKNLADRVLRSTPALGYVLMAVAAALPVLLQDQEVTFDFLTIAIFSCVAIGLNFTLGIAGELALGQVGIFAAAAYTAGILTAQYGWSFWAAWPAGVLVGTAVGLIAGAPGLRLGGWYFAMASIFIAVVVPDLVQIFPQAGGQPGFGNIPYPSIFGRDMSITEIYVMMLAVVGMLLLLFNNLTRSLWGLAFLNMRRSNRAAEASGINILPMKMLAYGLSSAVAGVGGGVFAHVVGYLAPSAFPLSLTILFIAAVVIGGLGSAAAPIVGVATLRTLPHLVSGFESYALMIYGALLIGVMLVIPRGILPTLQDGLARLSRRFGRVTPLAVRSTEPTNPFGTWKGMASGSVVAVHKPQAGHSLVVDGVVKHFGGVHALNQVSMIANPGLITAIIGPNGSGKTTLLNVILGFYRLNSGTVRLGDQTLSGKKPSQIARAGVGRTFQTPLIIAERTLRENVMCALFLRRKASFLEVLLGLPRARQDWRTASAAAGELLASVGLGSLQDSDAGTLTAGEQRLLEIARALAIQPTVVLLDEPAAGLIGAEVDALANLLRRLRDDGHVVVLVEHNIGLVMSLADQVTVLDRGSVIASGRVEQIQNDPVVLRSYLGEPTSA